MPKQREETPAARIISGDEAVALAAIDAGIRLAASYPGTPATDILEHLQRLCHPTQARCVWSVNEKVAYETALAAAIGGQRALVAMKHVGMNVAADAFVSSVATGVHGGLVVVVGDDAGCNSSQNAQDTRHYRALSGTILLEPADAQEAYEMVRQAFRISEQFEVPVLVKLATRVAYGCSAVTRCAPDAPVASFHWPRDPGRFLCMIPGIRNRLTLLARRHDEFETLLRKSPFSRAQVAGVETGVGIVCTGFGAALAQELASETCDILKVAGEPFPDSPLRKFVLEHERVVVLEEGDPLLERRLQCLAGEGCAIQGRLSGHLARIGELQPPEILRAVSGEKEMVALDDALVPPSRFPEVCAPCGYHKVFGAMKRIEGMAVPADIGCNTMGALPPYRVFDGNWSMGSSLGVACGVAMQGHPRVLAVIGDSTFFHAGLPPLIEAIQQRLKLTVLLLDNGVAAMTGGQCSCHRNEEARAVKIDFVRLIEVLGVTRCTPFEPHSQGISGIQNLIERSFEEPGVKVLLYRSQCGLYSPGYFTPEAFSLKKEAVHEVST